LNITRGPVHPTGLFLSTHLLLQIIKEPVNHQRTKPDPHPDRCAKPKKHLFFRLTAGMTLANKTKQVMLLVTVPKQEAQ
jgi:hypothetical protein